MKKYFIFLIKALVLPCILLISSCGSDNSGTNPSAPDYYVTGISPKQGKSGDTVVITGKRFYLIENPSVNFISMSDPTNMSAIAKMIKRDSTHFIIIVPPLASGYYSIQLEDKSLITPITSYFVLIESPYSITGISQNFGRKGDAISINGKYFYFNNKQKIKFISKTDPASFSVYANIISSTSEKITFSVPSLNAGKYKVLLEHLSIVDTVSQDFTLVSPTWDLTNFKNLYISYSNIPCDYHIHDQFYWYPNGSYSDTIIKGYNLNKSNIIGVIFGSNNGSKVEYRNNVTGTYCTGITFSLNDQQTFITNLEVSLSIYLDYYESNYKVAYYSANFDQPLYTLKDDTLTFDFSSEYLTLKSNRFSYQYDSQFSSGKQNGNYKENIVNLLPMKPESRIVIKLTK